MPYADPEKKREVDRKGKARARAEKKAEESEEVREKARCKGARVDVHRLSGIGSGELAGCAGRVSPSMGVQSAPRSRRKRHRRAEKGTLAHSPVLRRKKGLRANLEHFRGY